jgi:hypothetical protein
VAKNKGGALSTIGAVIGGICLILGLLIAAGVKW